MSGVNSSGWRSIATSNDMAFTLSPTGSASGLTASLAGWSWGDTTAGTGRTDGCARCYMQHAAVRPPNSCGTRLSHPRAHGSLSTIAHLLGTHSPAAAAHAPLARVTDSTEEGQQVRISV